VDWRDSSSDPFRHDTPTAPLGETGERIPSSRRPRRERRANGARRTRRPWYVWLIGGCVGLIVLTALLCGALAGLAVGVFQFVLHEPTATADTTRTFNVQNAPHLVVTNPAGAVTIAPGDDGSIRIEATRHARDRTDGDAQKALDTVALDLTQDGDTVTIVMRLSGRGSAWPGAGRGADFIIHAPVKTSVLVNAGAGAITVGALISEMALRVDAGNIHVTGATFTGVSQAQVGAGNVTIDGALDETAALDVRIDAGDATLVLPATTAAHIQARTSAGDVKLTGWPIPVRRTSDATLLAAGDTRPGALARLTVEVGAGDILIQAR
jgi:hypothetical protein